MEEHDGAFGDALGRRGRLHGRLLQVLGAVSAVAAAIALWQFDVFGGDPEPDTGGTVEGLETPSIPDGTVTEGATDSAQASSSAGESASESTAAATSAEPSSETSNPLPPSDTTAPEEEAATPADSGCTASLTLRNEWEDSIEVSVEVVNTGGEALESWELDLDLDGAEIYNYWNMRDLGDGRYGSEDWNARLDPDENAIAGFQAQTDDDLDLPDSVPCTARS